MKKKLIFIIYIVKKIISLTLNIKSTTIKNNIRKLNSDSTLYGNAHIEKYYYVNLYLGKLGIKQSYLLDTGSSITTSPCNLCKDCGKHKNNYYSISNETIINCDDPKCYMVNSNCFEGDCNFIIGYLEGSNLEGIYVNEIVRFGDNYTNQKLNYIPIGCTTKETHLFRDQLADGIIGLSNSEYNFVSVLKKNNIIKKNIFSICLSQFGGYFTIDDINKKYHLSKNILYTNIEWGSHFYIKVNSINVLNETIDISKRIFIDSGTTYTYFPTNITNIIIKKIRNICNKEENKNKCGIYERNKNYGACFYFNNNDEILYAINNIFPNITFNINNDLEYIWIPKNYYYNFSSVENNSICLGFNDEVGSFIFGSTWMRGYDIIFDNENEKIGFVMSDCNKGIIDNIGEDLPIIDNKNDVDNKLIDKNICDDITESNNWNYYIIYILILGVLIGGFLLFIFAIFNLRRGRNFLLFKIEGEQMVKNPKPIIEMNSNKFFSNEFGLFPDNK